MEISKKTLLRRKDHKKNRVQGDKRWRLLLYLHFWRLQLSGKQTGRVPRARTAREEPIRIELEVTYSSWGWISMNVEWWNIAVNLVLLLNSSSRGIKKGKLVKRLYTEPKIKNGSFRYWQVWGYFAKMKAFFFCATDLPKSIFWSLV